jgi:hypothetical protein
MAITFITGCLVSCHSSLNVKTSQPRSTANCNPNNKSELCSAVAPEFNIAVVGVAHSSRTVDVSITAGTPGVIYEVVGSKSEDCVDPVIRSSGESLVTLVFPEDGRFFVCGFVGTVAAKNNPVAALVDTNPPDAASFDLVTYNEPFSVDLSISDLSSYSVVWSVLTGGNKVVITNPTTLDATISATDYGDYAVKVVITDARGHETVREIAFAWRFCAGSRLTMAPFANSGEAGAGSASTPFLVCTLAQLDQVRTALAGHFELAGNIDASATASQGAVVDPDGTPNSGDEDKAGFIPIGTVAAPFTGTFDGKGHSIAGLTMHSLATNGVGLFGVASGATIHDIEITGLKIKSNGGYTGGLVGLLQSSASISRAFVSGIIDGGFGVCTMGCASEITTTSSVDWIQTISESTKSCVLPSSQSLNSQRHHCGSTSTISAARL